VEQVGLLRAWIDQGAVWPDNASANMKTNEIIGRSRRLSAWRALRPAKELGAQSNRQLCACPLEKEKLKPAPEADRITLIRRLSLDLVGLPPTIKEWRTSSADRNADAYEKLVERLLASPHYGERWGGTGSTLRVCRFQRLRKRQATVYLALS